MHDLSADRFQESVNLIDVAALPHAQAYVMQPDALLLELLCAIRIVASHNTNRSPSADAVESLIVVDHRLHAEIIEQFFIEWQARLEIAHREHHMGDAVDFHRVPSTKKLQACGLLLDLK